MKKLPRAGAALAARSLPAADSVGQESVPLWCGLVAGESLLADIKAARNHGEFRAGEGEDFEKSRSEHRSPKAPENVTFKSRAN